MDLQAPPRPCLPVSYRKLFAAERPDVSTVTGQKALWMAFRKVLNTWASTLQKFLHEDEDQFELLMTLDEYCSGHSLFSGPVDPVGRMYLPIFSNVLFELWDKDLLNEKVARDWQEAKLEDDEDDRVHILIHTVLHSAYACCPCLCIHTTM
jgi:hypothetical protein